MGGIQFQKLHTYITHSYCVNVGLEGRKI